jgi:glycosyltransferase involved in cell wall biosynthesis
MQKLTTAFQAEALESNSHLMLPGLWEVLPLAELSAPIWAQLEDPESLVRHCLNSRRVERIVRLLRRLRPDLVYLCDSSLGLLAPYVKSVGLRVVVGPHNFDSGLYATMADAAPTDFLRRWNGCAARAFAAAEHLYAPYLDQLWVCSNQDAQRFAGHVDPDRIFTVPNVFDVGPPSPLPEAGADLVFIGQSSYFPNEDAIQRLFGVSRGLDARGVVHRMRIVGRIGDHLRKMAHSSPSVEIVGEVSSTSPYLERAQVIPVALTLGGGTRLKILEGMAAARPILSTPIGIEGIGAENGLHAVIESDLNLFPLHIEALLKDRKRASDIALAGWRHVQENYSHGALLRSIEQALSALGLADGVQNEEKTERQFVRNMGALVLNQTIQFNPLSRLLSWTLLVRLAANFDSTAAEFSFPYAEVSNAFVVCKHRERGLLGLEASAILPPGVNPSAASIRVYAFGRLALHHHAPKDIKEEAAGLLTLAPWENGAELSGWVTGNVVVEPEFADAAETDITESGVRIVTCRYPKTPVSVSFATLDGIGQKLPNTAVWLGPRRPSTERLRQLRDRHAGEAAWLIGNGPSVRLSDLDRLQGRLTFCFNRFYLAHDTTSLRPTYTATGDRQMIEDFGQDIVDRSGGTVFVADEHAPDLVGDYIWLRQIAVYPPLFSKSPHLMVSPGGSTPFVAMQLAYYMGVRKFYFYGADFTFKFQRSLGVSDAFRIASGEGNHFIANYRDNRPWCPPSLRDIGASFLAARLLVESEGGFIRNVTHGGALEIFPREDFESALAS